jgi:hypothetical protein
MMLKNTIDEMNVNLEKKYLNRRKIIFSIENI